MNSSPAVGLPLSGPFIRAADFARTIELTAPNAGSPRRYGSIGAEIGGVDLSKPLDAGAKEALSTALAEHLARLERSAARVGIAMPLSAADLLAVASNYGSFPILLETYRECLRDVFDLTALTGLMGDIRSRRVRVVGVDTAVPSPFASAITTGSVVL